MKLSNKSVRLWLFALSAGAALSSTLTVHAVEYTWDNAGTAGIQTGTGNWSTGGTNWTTDGGGTRIGWPNAGTDSALFAGPISADITISLNSTDIQLDDFTSNLTSNFLFLQQVSSGTVRTLTLTGGTYDGTGTTGSQFNIAGGSVSFAGAVGTTRFQIAGSSDIVKLGAGNLFFSSASNNNTFVGNIYIKQGNLLVNNTADDTSLGDPANDIYIDGGILASNGTADTSLTLGSGRTITLGAGNGSFTCNNINFIVQGQITGVGSLTKTGSKNLILEAASDYSGTTTISGGILRLEASGTLPSSSNVTINTTGNFEVRNTSNWVYNGLITGDGTGAVTLNAGTNATLAGNISGVAVVNLNSPTTNAIVSGNITGATTIVNVQSGGGILTLAGDNSAMGGTVTLNGAAVGAQLNVKSATALGTGALSIGGGNNGKIDNTIGSALTLTTNNPQTWNNNFSFVGTDDLNLGTGAVTMGGSRTVFVTAKTLTVGGAIGGVTFALTKASFGTLALTGTSTYTGNTNINNGALNISSIKDYSAPSAVGAPASGDIQLSSGNNFSTLSYTGAGDSTNRTVKLGDSTPANTGLGAIQNNGSGALTFTAANFNPTITGITVARTLFLGGSYNSANNEIQGIIQDNDTGAGGKVNVGKGIGDSIWLLSGANTYTGSTIVQAGGALKLGASGSIASSTAVIISAGGTLDTSAQATHTIPATQTLAFGIDAAGSGSSGKITAQGLNISAAVVTYNIAGTPNDPVYVLATYTPGQLTGTFASVPTPPTGYTLNYAYEGNKIALVQSAVSGYAAWQAANGPTTQTINLDHDSDGVSNGIEYFLGGNTNTTGFTALPPVVNTGGTLSITWTKAATYTGVYGTDFWVETSATLANPWTNQILDPAPGFTVTITGNAVKYTFPAGTTNFARLKVTGP